PCLLRYPPETVVLGKYLNPAAVEPLGIAVGLPVQDVVVDGEQRAVLDPARVLRRGDHGIGVPGGAVGAVAINVAEGRLRPVRAYFQSLAAEAVVGPSRGEPVGAGVARRLAKARVVLPAFALVERVGLAGDELTQRVIGGRAEAGSDVDPANGDPSLIPEAVVGVVGLEAE